MSLTYVAIRFDYSDYDLSSACAIGLLKIVEGTVVKDFYKPFSPSGDAIVFTEDAGQTGGLRAEDVEHLNCFDSIWPEVEEFIEDLPLVANSASIYMKTLELLWDEFSIKAKQRAYLCTQVLGRRCTTFGSFNLEYYAHQFGFELPAIPNALDKAKATSEIVSGLAKTCDAKSLEELAEKAGVQWGTISSDQRLACKVIRHYDDRMTAADRQSLRDKYQADGFDPTHPLFEKYVVITGTLRHGTGKEIDDLIAKVGGYPQENFTKKTNYLVVGFDRIEGLTPGGKPTRKIEQSIEARSKGQEVEVVDEQTFLDLLEA